VLFRSSEGGGVSVAMPFEYLSPDPMQIRNHVLVLPCGSVSDEVSTDWTVEELKRSVSYFHRGVPMDGMFGGFVFTAIRVGSKRFMHPLFVGFEAPATHSDWLIWLDSLFAPGVNFDALSTIVKEHNRDSVDVWVSLPYPHPRQDRFGDVHGRSLSFHSLEDRCEAIRWWIDKFMERWAVAGELRKSLNFKGFLWQREAIDASDEQLVKLTNGYVKNQGIHSMWLPNYRSYGHTKCNEYGFDLTAVNPNYYGNSPCDYEWIHHAYKFAKVYRTGMQITFGKGMVYSENHLLDYLNLSLLNRANGNCFFVYQLPNQSINEIYFQRLTDYKRLYSFMKGTYRITNYPDKKY